MVASHSKLIKADGKVADELEKQIANALSELSSSAEIKGQLNELYFVGAQVSKKILRVILRIFKEF